jgi:FtsZ-binding cell division protein ZapB
MSNINDLEVLSKYLSEEELKTVAKEVAYAHFSSKLKEDNPYAKSNLEFYIGQGALQAVLQYGNELNFDFHAQELKEKTSKLIKGLQNYQLPNTYTEIAKEQIESQREEIQNRMKQMISDFVNGGDYPSTYSTFTQAVGEQLGDMLYTLLEEKFKKNA